MYHKTFITASAVVALAAAVPMQSNKRAIEWVTVTDVDVVTVPVTVTSWLGPGETAPVAASHYGHGHHSHSKVTYHTQLTVTVSAASAPTVASSSSYESPSGYESPTTSAYVAPTPTSTYVPPVTSTSAWTSPTTSAAAPATTSAASSSSSSSGSNGLTGLAAAGTSYTGDLTWYDTGLGACGWTSGEDDAIVAISEVIFDTYNTGNPNDNPVCGKNVTITGANGSPYTATIVDRCTGCAEGDLDLSEGFFNTVTDDGNGRVPGMHWEFDQA